MAIYHLSMQIISRSKDNRLLLQLLIAVAKNYMMNVQTSKVYARNVQPKP
ncbi:hypothetical protein G3M54_05145 [Bacillus megaterium NBRC 15308 = ATCC 14581]|nr:hypothetical protein [Priestia megaterium NBRC 15308 = ATCC 14581]